MNTFLSTFLILLVTLPFALRDGKRYKVVLVAILLLLPFYQVFIYFRYMSLLFVFLAMWQGDDRQFVQYAKEPVNRWMIIFFILSLVSGFLSADVFRAITPITDLMFFYLMFLLSSIGISRQLTTSLVPKILLWSLLGSVFIQTMQLYGVQAFYIYAEDRLNMNTGIGYDNSDRVVRYWGPFGNALTFSSYLAILGLFLFGYYNSSPQKKARRLSYTVLAIAVYGVILTSGRTAFISLVVGLLIYTFVKDWKKALVLMVCLVVVGLLFSAVIDQFLSGATRGIYQRFTNLGDDKSYRTETWMRALPVLLESPVFGTGPGNLQTQIAPLVRSIFINDKDALNLPWGHVENTYLSVLYTFGLSGFACFIYMLVKSLLYSFRAISRHPHPAVRQVAYGLTTAWIGIIINMIANPVFVTDYRLIVLMLFFVAYAVQVGWTPARNAVNLAKPVKPAPVDLPHLTQLA